MKYFVINGGSLSDDQVNRMAECTFEKVIKGKSQSVLKANATHKFVYHRQNSFANEKTFFIPELLGSRHLLNSYKT